MAFLFLQYLFDSDSVILVLKMKENSFFRNMYIIGLVFSAYGLLMVLMMGPLYFFNYFFLVWGLVLIYTSTCHIQINEKLGEKMYTVLKAATYICLAIFLSVEAMIFAYSFSKPEKDASIIIVLGSGVNRNGSLSSDFKARLDAGREYYEENGGTIVVTGKKGRDEPIAEALAAKEYLVKMGVKQTDIRVDDQSKNTHENILNAYNLTRDIQNGKTVIVSTCFHLFRANFIAHKIGFDDVSLKPSVGNYLILPHYYAREFFALVKDFIVLNDLL